MNDQERKLKAEWILAQSMLGEINSLNDFSKESYMKSVDTNRISFETWTRYFTKHKKEVLSRLEHSKEYKDFDGTIKPIEDQQQEKKEPEFFTYRMNPRTGEYEVLSVNLDNVADFLINKYQIKTWFGNKNDYSFNFDGKIYKNETRGIVKQECENLLGKHCKRNVVDEVFEKIKRKTPVEREEFEYVEKDFICLENGVYSIKEKKLLEHNPKYNFRQMIPVTYDEAAECPNWMKFLKETLYPEDILVMQEWFGFMTFREYFIKKAIICFGDQNTGKTVLLDTAIKFIGEKNKTGLSLQKLTNGSDFTKLSLKEKHANIYDDLSSKDLADGGAFKVATGGGYISGEEKFGEYQQFKSYAKQMFATNKIPPVKDNDDLAYFGRWMPIKFDNIPDRLDPFLKEKLWTNKELSGILNWALEGLHRLLDNGKFSYNKSPEEIKVLMQENSCPLVAFGNECLIQDDGARITKDEMYKVYSAWCLNSGKPRLSKEMLGRQLTKYCLYILAGKDKERIWKNARLKGSWQKVPETPQTELETRKEPNNDTSDTSKNIICTIEKEGNNIHNISFKKESEVSEEDKKEGFVPTSHELAQAGLTEKESEVSNDAP